MYRLIFIFLSFLLLMIDSFSVGANTIPKISVIVPVYNSESYLKKCLDSIVNQTLKNIEIICVNDGSLDIIY